MSLNRRAFLGAAGGAALVLTGCGVPPVPGSPGAPGPSPEGPPSRTPAASPPPTFEPTTPSPIPTASPTPAPSLVGDTRNAWAFARLDAPDEIVVEGEVSSQRAWSTSKVLVVAAFLAGVLDGDPDRATATQRRQMIRSFTESDMDSVIALGSAIPGGKQSGMSEILRSVGDTETSVPSRSEGTMSWKVRQQVRFLVALHQGRVVSPEASRFMLDQMHPIESQSWGLGSVGATAFKGGWLRANTETRQMGILDGFAVAIITSGVGPAEVQSDGDSAHVRQMNRLAEQLRERLHQPG